jgi:hypothetical protein
MSVRLESFQYLPRGADGWGSRLLHFGNLFTAVQGRNGSGKTPIMKGVMQGLGHEVELPPDILKRCQFAETKLMVDGRPVTLTRRLEPEFEITFTDDEETRTFTSEAEYAQWFVGLFNAEERLLTTRQNQSSPMYATVLLPSLWVDQDHGWTTDYWTPTNRNFIQDQRQEVIRFLLGLPARHPFRQRSEFDAAKDDLAKIEKNIELQRFVVERLRTNGNLGDTEEPRLIARRDQLRQDLDANGEVIEAIRSATAFFDREIAALETQRDELLERYKALTARRGQLSLVLAELDGEEDILTANVQATDLLRQFCGREECQMFATSERSFGRSLLFLKDQIKDLKTSDRDLGRDAESLAKQIGELDDALSVKRRQRQEAVASSPQAELVGKLAVLTKEFVDVELRLAKVQQYATEQKKFDRLLDRREQAAAAVAQSRPGRGKNASPIDDARQVLADAMQRWLATLGTENTKSASFDEDFVLYVDGAKFAATTHQSGSTRTRIVLAFHATLLEVALARGGNHPGWLLFDAPKQHELSQTDFDAYTDNVAVLAAKYPQRVQMVFSVADLKTQIQAGDEVWLPRFTTADGKPRFLGPPEQQPSNDPIVIT